MHPLMSKQEYKTTEHIKIKNLNLQHKHLRDTLLKPTSGRCTLKTTDLSNLLMLNSIYQNEKNNTCFLNNDTNRKTHAIKTFIWAMHILGHTDVIPSLSLTLALSRS